MCWRLMLEAAEDGYGVISNIMPRIGIAYSYVVCINVQE